ncbi:MAG: LL-diaminopimelate aminotransferase [Pseudanabaenaceae cyanobacterium bins.68]|nr:LL-diaminopimelate aminotransferase [Pseudanabaenaceae cyanobacterium bins.68]
MVMLADRLQQISQNVFVDMDRAKYAASQAGKSLIDLSLGSSDLPTSDLVVQEIVNALADPHTHGYTLFSQTQAFRQAVAQWLQGKFGIRVDPETEVLPLIGSQEGTGHFPLVVLNPGDYALCQDPGYPSHYGGVSLAGGQCYGMKLRAECGFLPQWAEIPLEVLTRAKMMILSYPHNPTTAIATPAFFKSAVEFCQAHNLVLVHDFPYVDFVLDGSSSPSILQAQPSLAGVIEFFSLSKSYNMGGFRIGFAVGDRALIQGLKQVKAVIDFNQYQGIMQGGIAALNYPGEITRLQHTYRERRDHMIAALHKLANWQIDPPLATMYLWAKLPLSWPGNSLKFCLDLVAQTGVTLAPGIGFGSQGEGYVRFALVHPPARLEEAAARIGGFLSQAQDLGS